MAWARGWGELCGVQVSTSSENLGLERLGLEASASSTFLFRPQGAGQRFRIQGHRPHLKPEPPSYMESALLLQVLRKVSGACPTCTQSLQRVLVEQF